MTGCAAASLYLKDVVEQEACCPGSKHHQQPAYIGVAAAASVVAPAVHVFPCSGQEASRLCVERDGWRFVCATFVCSHLLLLFDASMCWIEGR